MKKFKITYFEYGTVNAKIINSWGFSNIINDINGYASIMLDNILKIELILEADKENVEDLTEKN